MVANIVGSFLTYEYYTKCENMPRTINPANFPGSSVTKKIKFYNIEHLTEQQVNHVNDLEGEDTDDVTLDQILLHRPKKTFALRDSLEHST